MRQGADETKGQEELQTTKTTPLKLEEAPQIQTSGPQPEGSGSAMETMTRAVFLPQARNAFGGGCNHSSHRQSVTLESPRTRPDAHLFLPFLPSLPSPHSPRRPEEDVAKDWEASPALKANGFIAAWYVQSESGSL